MQVDWDERFLELVDLIKDWSTCPRIERKIGALIVKNGEILGYGYNDVPADVIKNCTLRGKCMRKELNIESGTRLEHCYNVCAEQSAILSAYKNGHEDLTGATLYTSCYPCSLCARWIIKAGISRVVYRNDYPHTFTNDLFKEAGVKVLQK